MKITRRRFASFLGAGALTHPAWAQAVREVQEEGRVSAEAARALLDAQGDRGIFGDSEWFELLRRALELAIETREILRTYPIPDDVDPAITFKRD
jgi:hypothetical protein